MLIRDDLDLHMARSTHDLFQEDRWVAEGFEGLAARARQGFVKLAGRAYPANAMTSAAGGGLDEHGIPQALGLPPRIVKGFHWAAAPVSNRYLRLVRQVASTIFCRPGAASRRRLDR